MPRGMTRQRECMLVTSLGFCLRVIVNETHINLEKTTSTVPSVIFINLWVKPKTTALRHFKVDPVFKIDETYYNLL